MKLFKQDHDWVLRFNNKTTLTLQSAKSHWIPGIVYWPGLDNKGNTLNSVRLISFPRWIFHLSQNLK